MDNGSPFRIWNYGFDDYFMQENDLEDGDANRFSPNNALQNMLGSTAPLGVGVGSLPLPSPLHHPQPFKQVPWV